MKRFITLLCIVLLASIGSYGKSVDASLAKKAALHFLGSFSNVPLYPKGTDITLVYNGLSDQKAVSTSGEPQSRYYIFNLTGDRGFVIVSGDDIAQPILAYSSGKSFSAGKIPPHVAAWLDFYKQEIEYAIGLQKQQTAEIAAMWNALLSESPVNIPEKSTYAVAPLLQTQWDQSPNYNALCPYDNDYQEYTVTGCVATAMAQVMKYWNSPQTGTGFHSYNSSKYGTLSADFGSTTYQWASMPSSISGPNNAIATLMFHCGVSVDMAYGVAETGGSSAYVVSSQSPGQNCAEYAMKTYFGYDASLQGLMRDNYTLSDWQNMLKTELDASRPVLYAGIGSGGGHCFVCDGYDNSNFFHFNWGWSGLYDGYFQIDALNPGGVGTGGGTGGFNSYQQALFGVQPTNNGGGGQNYTLQLYDNITPSSPSIDYGASFSVHTDIWNNSSADFSGDFCAAIFDATGTFVDYVEIMSGMNLPAGYHYTSGLTFSNSGLLTMLPGTYTIGIYSRPTGGNWSLVEGGSYASYITIDVVNTNDIALYKQITVSPGVVLVRYGSVSVHLDVANYGSTNFNGTFDVSLYDLNGNFVFTIQQYTGMSLQAGYHYTNGLTFSNTNLDVDPGTYLLALQHKPDGGSWELSGSQNYPNPILVTVQDAALSPDAYEPNNDVNSASNLLVKFTGNNAEVLTTGSNCNTGNDYDYYKIQLPTGNNYQINAWVYDSQNPNGSQTYSLDAVFSYDAPGQDWSPVYDEAVPKPFNVNGGGTVYFFVSPKYTGSTGTYLLDIQITKGAIGIDEASASLFLVYPNPAGDFFTIEFKDLSRLPETVSLFNSEGKEMLSKIPVDGQKTMNVSTSGIPDGNYYIRMQFNDGTAGKMVVIRHRKLI